MPDDLYAKPLSRVGDFVFDDAVAGVFDDMITRSVPGYRAIVSMISDITLRFARGNTVAYDLGSSTGVATEQICSAAPENCRIVAIDRSPAMIERFRVNLARRLESAKPPLEVRLADVNQVDFEPTSLAVMNFTLQFIPVEQRDGLIARLAEATIAGGALLLSEKIRSPDPVADRWLIDLHHDYKRSRGYSDLEIAQKRTALEKTLIPETIERHQRRLIDAGYEIVTPWFQCLNFASLLAIRT